MSIEEDIAAAVRDRDSSSSNLRLGLWRAWLIFAALWMVSGLFQHWPWLTLDCGYLANVSHADWLVCHYEGDLMWCWAFASLTVPPPLVLIIGYWIVRGFRSDFGGINKRVAIGVALVPVWLFWLVLEMMSQVNHNWLTNWSRDFNLTVGSIIGNVVIICVIVAVYRGLARVPSKPVMIKDQTVPLGYEDFVRGVPFRRLPHGEFEILTETGPRRFPNWKTLWAWNLNKCVPWDGTSRNPEPDIVKPNKMRIVIGLVVLIVTLGLFGITVLSFNASQRDAYVFTYENDYVQVTETTSGCDDYNVYDRNPSLTKGCATVLPGAYKVKDVRMTAFPQLRCLTVPDQSKCLWVQDSVMKQPTWCTPKKCVPL